MNGKNILNFALFQLFWLAAVKGAAAGNLWLGPVAVLMFMAVHFRMIPAGPERARELKYVLFVGLFGSLADTILHTIGATAYPTSQEAWPFLVVPPWIASLWVGFALLPRFSLGWLGGRPVLAIVFGAVGGPLSYYTGTRFGAAAVGESALLTWSLLAVEYAVVTPLLLHYAARPGSEGKPATEVRLAAGTPAAKSAGAQP